MRDMTWKLQPNLALRRFKHACGVLKLRHEDEKIIVVAGGTDDQNSILNKVELLSMHMDSNEELHFAGQWEFGPDMPVSLTNAASATTLHQHALYIIGGLTNSEASKSVFKLTCLDTVYVECSWTKVDYELKIPTAMGVAIVMPEIPMVHRGYSNARNCHGKTESADVWTDESVLVLSTGWNGYVTFGDTEMFVAPSPNSHYSKSRLNLARCQPSTDQTQSMYTLASASGAVLKAVQDEQIFMPIVCGGFVAEGVDNHYCYNLGDPRGSTIPKIVGTMKETREGSASIAVLEDTTLWVTGGISEAFAGTDTTEWIDVSKALTVDDHDNSPKSLSYGISLPIAMAWHCLELVNEEMAILYGGVTEVTQSQVQTALHTTWTIDVAEHVKFSPAMLDGTPQQWTPRAPMNHGRYSHTCGVIRALDIDTDNANFTRKFVLAAGGVDQASHSGFEQRVELLQVDEYSSGQIVIRESWMDGCLKTECPLPATLSGAASASTKDQTVLFVAGGVIANNMPSMPIYSVRCKSPGVCWWTKETAELTFARHNAVAMMIPPRKQNPSGRVLS